MSNVYASVEVYYLPCNLQGIILWPNAGEGNQTQVLLMMLSEECISVLGISMKTSSTDLHFF